MSSRRRHLLFSWSWGRKELCIACIDLQFGNVGLELSDDLDFPTKEIISLFQGRVRVHVRLGDLGSEAVKED